MQLTLLMYIIQNSHQRCSIKKNTFSRATFFTEHLWTNRSNNDGSMNLLNLRLKQLKYIEFASKEILDLRLLLGFRYGKKTFCRNSDKFGYSFIKNEFCLCIYFVFTKIPLF